ncbi:hypothetical protein KUTeg_005869 [Tegillarca granosa]|uniref:ATP synthase-coupling factor 6, mitochondrial n=1 Tax=Tegillarca granosa TaxID=220873 RepID=A0ABQ9FH20_TEGGR|nr:hypothetical protein KUTeg_005869 [Tegillarca granosa]
MFPSRLVRLRPVLLNCVKRNIGLTAAASQKTNIDPIQKAAGGELVDADPKVMKELQKDINKVKSMYGADKEDLLQMPVFNFSAEHSEDIFAQYSSPRGDIEISVGEEEDDDSGFDEKLPFYQRNRVVMGLA